MLTIFKLTSKNDDEKIMEVIVWKGTFLPKQMNEYREEIVDNSNSNFTLNCAALFANDEQAIEEAKNWTYKMCSDEKLLRILENGGGCATMRRRYAFLNRSMSKEEKEFPIAYGILVYHNADQV